MKIYSVGYNINREKVENSKQRYQIATTKAPFQRTQRGDTFVATSMNSSISFASASLKRLLPKTKDGQYLSKILNCAFCDKPMIEAEELFSIVWPSEKEEIKIYNQKLIQILKPFTHLMHKEELSVFNIIKDLNSKYPNKTFQQLLSMVRQNSFEPLAKKENKILNNLKYMSNDFPESVSTEIKELIKDSQSRIQLDRAEHPFRRGAFIERLEDILKPLSKEARANEISNTIFPNRILEILEEDKKVQRLIDKAYHLPSSKSDRNAFIVKYADYAQKADGFWAPRSSQEISHNLLCGAKSTLDHLMPRNPIDPSDVKGEDIPEILVYACEFCNAILKQNLKATRFVIRFPQAPENMKKQAYHLIDKINDGTIPEGAPYARGIADTYDKLSTKEIDFRVDISRLKK